jgi:lambda family phage portal protein
MPGLRGYSAAENVARYGDFKSSRGSADYELREGLAEVRAKVRFLARNSGSMRRYMQLMAVNIVGESGFRLQSRVRQAGGSAATSLNKRVQDAFMAWSEAPTTCGQLHMIELESQAVKTFARDGEVIWEFVTGPQYVDGIAINPLEADMLDETLNTTHPPTKNEIRMGVEVDSYGRPVAYHFLTTHPGDLTWYSYQSNRRYRRVPADRVIHLFEKSRPGQTRGEPPAASMVLNVKMLDGYREAETMSRRLRAALMGFFENQMPETRGISELADDDDDTEKPDDEPFEMQMEPGRLKQLPRGVTFKEFSPGGSQHHVARYGSVRCQLFERSNGDY